MSQMKDIVAKKAAFVVDVREPDEVAEGMIPTAVHVRLGQVPSVFNLPDAEFEKNAKAKKPAKNAPIVVYCRAGCRARTAAGQLAQMGFTNVKVYPGGWSEWQ